MPNIKRANTSGITKSGVAIADVPDAPTIGSATAVDSSSATVAYTAATTGGTATTFTATSTPGSLTGTGSSPITVSGLTGLTSYTFTVRASNSTGNSPFSSASNSITTPALLAWDSIATVTGNGSATSLSFTSIPQTYKHLQLRIIARSTTAATGSGWIDAVFNGDSTSNYSFHYVASDGDSAVSGNGINRSSARIGTMWSSSNLANSFTANICDILDYTNTNKYKATRSLIGGDTNGNTYSEIYLASNSWRSTSAITQIDLSTGGWTFATGTSIALYGIKG